MHTFIKTHVVYVHMHTCRCATQQQRRRFIATLVLMGALHTARVKRDAGACDRAAYTQHNTRNTARICTREHLLKCIPCAIACRARARSRVCGACSSDAFSAHDALNAAVAPLPLPSHELMANIYNHARDVLIIILFGRRVRCDVC